MYMYRLIVVDNLRLCTFFFLLWERGFTTCVVSLHTCVMPPLSSLQRERAQKLYFHIDLDI